VGYFEDRGNPKWKFKGGYVQRINRTWYVYIDDKPILAAFSKRSALLAGMAYVKRNGLA
jgi:hypothetical protein